MHMIYKRIRKSRWGEKILGRKFYSQAGIGWLDSSYRCVCGTRGLVADSIDPLNRNACGSTPSVPPCGTPLPVHNAVHQTRPYRVLAQGLCSRHRDRCNLLWLRHSGRLEEKSTGANLLVGNGIRSSIPVSTRGWGRWRRGIPDSR